MTEGSVKQGLLGRIEEFNLEASSWTAYAEQYMIATGNKDDSPQKVAVFLIVIGPRTYSLLRDLAHPQKPAEKKYSELVAMLEKHFQPKRLVVAERFKFHSRVQKPDEAVRDYLAALRKLSEHCDFKEFRTEALRDRFVCGLNNESIQRKLLTEDNLTLDKALNTAQSVELAARQATQLQKALESSQQPEGKILELSRATTKNSRYEQPAASSKTKTGQRKTTGKPCWRCGRSNHTAWNCYFKDSECRKCHKRGHVERACKSKGATAKHVAEDAASTDSDEDGEAFEQYGIYRTEKKNIKSSPWLIELQLDTQPVTMEIDTGASMTILSSQTYRKLWKNGNRPTLRPTNVKLRSYGGHPISVLGTISVSVKTKPEEQARTLQLLVVEGNGPNLLGRDWLVVLQLDWHQVHRMTSHVEELLSRYREVFDNHLGSYTGQPATIFVDPQAAPRYCKARSIPYALKDLVSEELSKLERDGVISPVKFSDWAAPIVPVLKKGGKAVRICGDYKMTVNRAARLEQYPIPKIEDLFASLAGGQVFSKLDLTQAYTQIPLEEEAKKLTTINTPRGLYQFNRLPFGISSAPAIFQRVMEGLLLGVKGVSVYVDDILVTGRDEDEHLRHLEEVLKRLKEAGLTVKREKCQFMARSIEYLGHRIDAEGLHPTAEKVEAMKRAPCPRNVTELKSFLGIINYYGKFVPGLVTTLAPLYELLRKRATWIWADSQRRAFRKAKQALSSSSVLVHYDSQRPTVTLRCLPLRHRRSVDSGIRGWSRATCSLCVTVLVDGRTELRTH